MLEKIFSKNYIPFLIIAGLGFILYFQAFFFDFSYLDDNVLVLGNQAFLANLGNIFASFSTDVFHLFNHSAFYYRPILTISFMFDYQFGGASPFMYHFTNVLLHLGAACLLFIFLKKLNYKKELSLFFSLIFVVHPVLTQAVAWIPGRNDSLLAIFVLATFIFFINYLKDKKLVDMVWSLVFFGLALFTKESAIFIFPIMVFYFYFLQSERQGIKNALQNFYYFLWAIGIGVAWVAARHFALAGSTPATLLNMIKSVFINLPATVQLIGKIFLPFNLSVLPIMQDTTFVYGIIATILFVLIILLTKNKRFTYILFGFGWFFAFLLPSFIRPNPLLPSDFIEHRLYVPIIGIFIILLETDFIRKIDFKKKTVLAATGALLLGLSIITLVHSRSFVDKLAFWKNAAENSPHYPLAHRNLGAMEYLNGDLPDAEQEFKKALELNPTEEMAHNNLGLVYVSQNKLPEAMAEYKKELEVNPNYDNAYYNLGLLYWQEKMYPEAIADWKKTLELNPGYDVGPQVLQILEQNQ